VRATATFALLIVLALPAHAAARGALVDSDPVSEAVARAVAYWAGTPCGGSVLVVSGSSSEAPLAGVNVPSPGGPRAAMWSTWSSPAGANEFTAPSATFSDCVVHINLGVWPSWRADDADFPAFCKEMLHEYGHFEGHPDVGAPPDTIEYERPDLAHVPLCESYRLIYGHHVYRPMPPRARARRRAHRHAPARRTLQRTTARR
jgi:hypothetical protein